MCKEQTSLFLRNAPLLGTGHMSHTLSPEAPDGSVRFVGHGGVQSTGSRAESSCVSHTLGVDGESAAKPVGARAPWTARGRARTRGAPWGRSHTHTALRVSPPSARVPAGSSPSQGSTGPPPGSGLPPPAFGGEPHRTPSWGRPRHVPTGTAGQASVRRGAPGTRRGREEKGPRTRREAAPVPPGSGAALSRGPSPRPRRAGPPCSRTRRPAGR